MSLLDPRAALALDAATLTTTLADLGVAGRTKLLASWDRTAVAEVLGRLDPRQLEVLGRQGIAALGSYRAQLIKRERMNGSVGAPQTLELLVRPEPFAFRIDFTRGPSAGRRALYNVELERDEIRVKEAGMLGLAGALWLHLDNPLTRRDTNHRSTEIGLAALLDLIERDVALAEAFGGHRRETLGLDEQGLFNSVYHAPEGAKGLYAVSTRVGFDPALSVPVRIEVHDAQGFLESYAYLKLERATLPADAFTLKGAKL